MASRRFPRLLSFSSKSSLIVATIICIPFLTFYWLSLGYFLPETLTASYANWVNALSIILYLPFAFFAYTLFGNFYVYMLLMAISLTVSIISIIKNRPNKLHLSWSIMLVCSIIAFPFLFRYQPALEAAPGYNMQLVTDPGFGKGVVKASQSLVEITPCNYELLGWDTDNWLYYQETCDTKIETWKYSPRQSDSHTRALLQKSLNSETVSKDAVLEMVRAHGVKPESAEPSTRSISLISEGFASPDKNWTAIVSQHIYGAQDIVIFTNAE
jgi:hypothetical protein